eukprot:jgi/Psemu1/18437/gm1.18437_g
MAKLEHFGEGNEVYLSGVFKHLKGSNFKYHELLDFKTWECFEDSQADLKKFKHLKLYRAKDMVHPPHEDGGYKVQDNVNKSDEGNNKDGNLDNGGGNVSDPRQDKGNKSDQGNDKGGNLDHNSDNVSDPRQKKGNKSDEGNNKDGTSENNVGNTAKTVGAKSSVVKHLELDLKDWSFASHDIKVMFKDPDPEILYPISQIGQKVVYVGDINCIGLVDGCVSERYKDYDAHPGYKLFFQRDDGRVQCYSEKHGRKSGKRNKEGNLLGDEDSNSSSDSNNLSDNDKGSEYDLVIDGNSESKEDDEC